MFRERSDLMYTLYYRNYLKVCNYKCKYCPFPKEVASDEKIKKDKEALFKFADYIKESKKEFKIFIAPKGEALIYDYYKETIIKLSNLKNVKEIVIQTNLSSSLEWTQKADKSKLIMWTTYHPKQVESSSFFDQVKKLVKYQINFSVGVVGVRENFKKIEEMNMLLESLGDKKPYLWINAYKDKKDYYTREEIKKLIEWDYLFEMNLKTYETKGLECNTGKKVFYVDYTGLVYRCWQDKKKCGNLYKEDIEDINIETNCEKNRCGCYIGYNNLRDLKLEDIYKKSLIGRLPKARANNK